MNCELPFQMQRQTQSQWCWSAVATSVAAYFDPASPWTQCLLVNSELNQASCCLDGGTPQCNRPWTLDTALRRVGHLVRWIAGAVSFAGCDAEVCGQQRPLCVRIGWRGGAGGHFVAVTGIGDAADQFLTIQDPLDMGPTQIEYDTFVYNYKGSGSWTHSYYTK